MDAPERRRRPVEIYKIVKTWYVEAERIIEITKDKLSTMRKNADEIKISKVRD